MSHLLLDHSLLASGSNLLELCGHLLLDHTLLAVGTKVLEKSGDFAQLIPNVGLDVEILAEDERPR